MVITGWGVYKSGVESGQKTDEIFRLNEELQSQSTGGNSIFYFHVDGFGTPDAKAQLEVCGEYAIRDATIEVFDVSERGDPGTGSYNPLDYPRKLHTVQAAVHPYRSRKLRVFPFESNPTNDYYKYVVITDATNGTTQQDITFRRKKSGWSQSYAVAAVDDNMKRKGSVLIKYSDEPTEPRPNLECGNNLE